MKARAIAFYLPQYHPIPENDLFWGKGFTEWTNVTKARSLFRGHIQPNLPKDLGFYDLRLAEVREQQANLAKEAGIEGFCYWHYWFGNGKQALEKIFDEVVSTGKPDFPFCLGWANESWTGKWHGLDNEIIFEQKYLGEEDYIQHFNKLLPAFLDNRYIKVDGGNVFLIYRPNLIPDLKCFLKTWNHLAKKNNMKEFFFVSVNSKFDHSSYEEIKGVIPAHIFDVIYKSPKIFRKFWFSNKKSAFLDYLENNGLKLFNKKKPISCEYKDFSEKWKSLNLDLKTFPCAIPNWDNTPRSGSRGFVIQNPSPKLFGEMVVSQVENLSNRPFNQRLIFIKSWNEWAEGNHLEPNHQFGMSYISALKKALSD